MNIQLPVSHDNNFGADKVYIVDAQERIVCIVPWTEDAALQREIANLIVQSCNARATMLTALEVAEEQVGGAVLIQVRKAIKEATK